MNLVLVEPAELAPDGSVRLTGIRATHITTVLRGAPGQEIRVGVVDGPVGLAEIRSASSECVELRCRFGDQAPPRPPVDLLLALPRPKVMRRLWAQIAALGVDRIILTNAERVERHYFDTHILDPATYRPLLIEGLQQARDTRVPLVSIHKQFRVLVEDEIDAMCPHGRRVVAHPHQGGSVEDALGSRLVERVVLAVGPEGGWNAFELALLASRGFTPMGLGPRTLRTDTACIALLSLVHAAIARHVSSG